MYKAYKSVVKIIAKVMGIILICFMISMTLACFAQVVIRNLKMSVPWVEEVARYSSVWVTFLGGAYAYKNGSLAAVELLKNKLNGTPRYILELIIVILSFIFAVLLARGGFELVMTVRTQNTPSLKISKSLVYGALPVGALLMILFSVDHFVTAIRNLIKKGD